jgi:hypothetical protein
MRSNLELFLERLPVELEAAPAAVSAERTAARRATTRVSSGRPSVAGARRARGSEHRA